MGSLAKSSTKYQSTEGRKEEITTWQATNNLLIKNMSQRRKLATGIVKDSSRKRNNNQTNRQWKGLCRDQNVKVFKDATSPKMKYANRVYNAWDIKQECNQNFQEFQN